MDSMRLSFKQMKDDKQRFRKGAAQESDA